MYMCISLLLSNTLENCVLDELWGVLTAAGCALGEKTEKKEKKRRRF